jgi:hypothetical protein
LRLLHLKVQISLKTPLIKDTLNISEIKALTKDAQAPVSGIIGFLGGKKVRVALKPLGVLKTQGYGAAELLTLMILMPLLGIFSLHSFFESSFASLSLARKDAFYRLCNNPMVDWRRLHFGFVKQFLALGGNAPAAGTAGHKPRCWVVDDTIGEKTGLTIEGVGKLFDHTSHGYVLGLKYLFLGLWDGTSFIPVDFSIHRERGKNKDKPFGLRVKDYARRFFTIRPEKSAVQSRLDELDTDKIAGTIKMLKRAAKNGICADYLLVDSWFVCDALIKFVAESKHIGHIVGQCKNDKRNYLYQGGEYSGAALKKKLLAKWKRCRTLKMDYLQVDVDYKGVPLRLFFTRRHGSINERLLVTNDLGLSFTKAFEIYAIRWTIEVYFKESKQLLGLGKCQSTNFAAQIAAATICMMQYVALAHQKRIGSYQTIGGLFRECRQQAIEALLSERILAFILQLLHRLAAHLKIDLDDTMEAIFADEAFGHWMITSLAASHPRPDQAA